MWLCNWNTSQHSRKDKKNGKNVCLDMVAMGMRQKLALEEIGKEHRFPLICHIVFRKEKKLWVLVGY